VHSTPPTNTSAITIRAWTAITGEGTRLKREQLASEISHISDEQLRANLWHTMSKLFMFVVGDLEWDFLRAHGQRPEWIFLGSTSGMICDAAFSRLQSQAAAQQKAAAGDDDAQLLELEEKIFDLIHAIDDFDPEISRLLEIWINESERLYNEARFGNSTLSKGERSAIINAMPECIEHTRLCNLQQPLSEEDERLVKQMWSIPAKTPEGRRAKFFVLLAFFMPGEWSEASDVDADCDIEYARGLMIEMIGGEPAEQLRDQFAA
jgi:hypothetical protein